MAYADDLIGAGKIEKLKQWWILINEFGPAIGYYPNAKKSCLIVKEEYPEEAQRIFSDTTIEITTSGQRHLGAVIGSEEYKINFCKKLVSEWVSEIEQLALIAKTEPHAAYTNFTFSTKLKWNYALRTIPEIKEHLDPLEDTIHHKLIPAIIGTEVSKDHRNLLSLPPKLGGMGIINPTEIAEDEFQNSKQLTKELQEFIVQQNNTGKISFEEQKRITRMISNTREKKQKEKSRKIEESIQNDFDRKRIKMAQEKGASSWLTALPIKDLGFSLNKQEFQDAVALRYSLPIKNLPSTCTCGKIFTTDHAMICKMGGFVTIRHNELRDTIHDMLSEVCVDVKKEPLLIPLTGEKLKNASSNKLDNARVDVSARDFWSKGQRAFFDIRVFDPMAQSYRDQSLESNHIIHEKDKQRTYSQRIINIEHGSFTPLVFTISGGMSRGTEIMLTRLSDMIASKRGESHTLTVAWMRRKISFALLRAANLCLRGTRKKKEDTNWVPIADTNVKCAVVESHI